MKFHFVDSLIPFRKRNIKVEKLNLLQFFQQRYGIGKNLSHLLCRYSGYSIYYKGVNVKRSYISDKIRKLFVRKAENLDKSLKECVFNNISNLIKIGCYRGVRHNFKYPCRGQRTRSNARTRRRFNVGK